MQPRYYTVNNMLSLRQQSHMIGKSCTNSSGRRDWAQVQGQVSSSSSTTSPPSPAPQPRTPPAADYAKHGTIKVIHIFAPKIIKTDAAHFRELVQCLTGNSKRSRSGKSKRGDWKLLSPASPLAQQILSQHSNATQIYASSNRVEYTIPRPSRPCTFTASRMDFNEQKDEEDIKPTIGQLREPYSTICSGRTSDPGRQSPLDQPGQIVNQCFHNFRFSRDPTYVHPNRHDGLPNNNNLQTCRQQQQQQVQRHQPGLSSGPVTVDPFQSLSGYKEKLLPTPQFKFSTSTFPSFNDDDHGTIPTSKFSDMDILTGMAKPAPLPEFPLALPPQVNSMSDFTFQSSLLNNPNNLCRFSIQSPIRGGISQLFENF